MLRSIGKTSKSFFMKLLVSIMILPFVFWGMGDLFRGGSQNIVATIDSEKVSTQEFINYLSRLNLSQKEQKDLKSTDLIEKILTDYLGRKIVKMEIKDYGIKLSDSTLKDIIINDKTFFKNNKFSRTKYEGFLIESGFTAAQFEKNISEQEKRRQLLTFLSGGLVIPDFLVQGEYMRENQIKKIKYIDLNDYYKNLLPKKKEIQNLYAKNKQFFMEIFKEIKFVELKPNVLVGSENFNEQYFKKIDSIENDILDGKNIIQISKNLNLNLINIKEINKKKEDMNKVKYNNIEDILFKNIFQLQKEKEPALINLNDKYYLAEVTSIKKKQKNLNDKEILKNITDQIHIKNKIQNNSEIVKKISTGDFTIDKMKIYADKNNLKINEITISSLKDNQIFTEGLIKNIFIMADGEINLITDSMMSKNFIIQTISTKYNKINKESSKYKVYKNKAKLNFSKEIYSVYDKTVNTKYKVELNDKAIERIKNSF